MAQGAEHALGKPPSHPELGSEQHAVSTACACRPTRAGVSPRERKKRRAAAADPWHEVIPRAQRRVERVRELGLGQGRGEQEEEEQHL